MGGKHKVQGEHNGHQAGKQLGKAQEQPVADLVHIGNDPLDQISGAVAVQEGKGQLLDLPDPPTCILYPDDYSAFGGIKAIRRRGLRIPEDISIAGFDGTPIAEQIDPRLTTVAQNTEEMGRLAAMHLIEEIRHPKTSLVEVITVGTEVSPGESVGTCRK